MVSSVQNMPMPVVQTVPRLKAYQKRSWLGGRMRRNRRQCSAPQTRSVRSCGIVTRSPCGRAEPNAQRPLPATGTPQRTRMNVTAGSAMRWRTTHHARHGDGTVMPQHNRHAECTQQAVAENAHGGGVGSAGGVTNVGSHCERGSGREG